MVRQKFPLLNLPVHNNFVIVIWHSLVLWVDMMYTMQYNNAVLLVVARVNNTPSSRYNCCCCCCFCFSPEGLGAVCGCVFLMAMFLFIPIPSFITMATLDNQVYTIEL